MRSSRTCAADTTTSASILSPAAGSRRSSPHSPLPSEQRLHSEGAFVFIPKRNSALALDLDAADDVVTAVRASGVVTERQIADQARQHGIDEDEDEVVEKIMLAPAAVKRLVEPAEVAELAAVLYGPASASISGASLTMDGAWTAR